MTDSVQTRAGREGKKGDLAVRLTGRETGGVELSVKSSVGHMYGGQIEETARRTLEALGVGNCLLEIDDMGAFDYVIMARIEAAARRLKKLDGPGCLPGRRVEYGPPRRKRLRRTRLYMPGNNPDLMRNGGLFGADSVILDLEDSVSPGEKDAARILVRNTLLSIDYFDCERIVRINSLSTGFGEDDLAMVVPYGVDTIHVPKCESASDVKEVEKIIASLEKEHSLGYEVLIMPLIETAKGILNAFEIGASSERVVGLCFGAEDFTADIGTERTKEGAESLTARSMLVLGAKAAGVQAIDTVFSDVKDVDGLLASTREAMALGFEGKGVIHPAQIEPIHSVFSPAPERIEYAKKVVAAIEKARAEGSGVATIGSKMIDAPIETRARKILSLAEALGLLENETEGTDEKSGGGS
jgi:citrate lyase subunit beta/citryl-CoA lyase